MMTTDGLRSYRMRNEWLGLDRSMRTDDASLIGFRA
jgi:hypothetical protein